MKDSIEKRIALIFALVAGLLLLMSVVAVRNTQRSRQATDWVNHTHAVLSEADAVLAALQASEAAVRSYLLTGDVRDQAEAREAESELAEHLAVAKALTRAEPETHEAILEIGSGLQRRMDFAQTLMDARLTNGLAGATNALNRGDGGATLAEIKTQIVKLKADYNARLHERDTASYLQAQRTRWSVFVILAVNFLLLGFVAWLIRDDLALRRRAAAALLDANRQLEQRVQERTAELARSNEELSELNLERRWTNQALEHQLRYSQLIIDSITDLVFVVTKALNVTRVNPAVVRQTEMAATDIVGAPIERVLRFSGAGSAPPTGTPPLAQALRDGREIHDHPGVVVQTGGREVAVLINSFPLRDHDKVVGGVIAVRLRETRRTT